MATSKSEPARVPKSDCDLATATHLDRPAPVRFNIRRAKPQGATTDTRTARRGDLLAEDLPIHELARLVRNGAWVRLETMGAAAWQRLLAHPSDMGLLAILQSKAAVSLWTPIPGLSSNASPLELAAAVALARALDEGRAAGLTNAPLLTPPLLAATTYDMAAVAWPRPPRTAQLRADLERLSLPVPSQWLTPPECLTALIEWVATRAPDALRPDGTLPADGDHPLSQFRRDIRYKAPRSAEPTLLFALAEGFVSGLPAEQVTPALFDNLGRGFGDQCVQDSLYFASGKANAACAAEALAYWACNGLRPVHLMVIDAPRPSGIASRQWYSPPPVNDVLYPYICRQYPDVARTYAMQELEQGRSARAHPFVSVLPPEGLRQLLEKSNVRDTALVEAIVTTVLPVEAQRHGHNPFEWPKDSLMSDIERLWGRGTGWLVSQEQLHLAIRHFLKQRSATPAFSVHPIVWAWLVSHCTEARPLLLDCPPEHLPACVPALAKRFKNWESVLLDILQTHPDRWSDALAAQCCIFGSPSLREVAITIGTARGASVTPAIPSAAGRPGLSR